MYNSGLKCFWKDSLIVIFEINFKFIIKEIIK